jgi:nitrate reductase assembly molybdenum cofactor insertion protein NarJ
MRCGEIADAFDVFCGFSPLLLTWGVKRATRVLSQYSVKVGLAYPSFGTEVVVHTVPSYVPLPLTGCGLVVGLFC